MADYNVDFLEDRFPEEWLAAMRADVRRERVSLVLSRGGSKNDADIIQNSLYINHKVMGSKFDLGTCCTSEMGVSFIDENAIDTNYGGVLATVVYSLYIGADDDGSEKWYFSTQGPFIIDGQKARREGKVVTLKAYDILSNFDYEMPKQDIPEFENLYAAVEWLCDTVPLVNGVRFGAMPAEEFNKLPNADIVPDFSSGQIVSCRDALMWIAQATGTCVYYGRKGITFKQYKYTGNMAYDREITVQERERIEFTDTRTYCAYLTAETDSGTKIYSNVVDWDESWDPKYIKTGGLNLPKNPIISGLTQQQQEEVNKNILQNMSYPTRYVKMSGDVDFLLEPLDCAAFTGGSIDIRNMIISPITEINWKYRATGKIVCTNVDEYTDTLPDEVTPVLLSMAEEGMAPQSETAPPIHSPVYSQESKARQGLGGSSDRLITHNGAQIIAKDTSDWEGSHVQLDVMSKDNELLCSSVIRNSGGFIARTFDKSDPKDPVWTVAGHSRTEGFSILNIMNNRTKQSISMGINGVDQGYFEVCLGYTDIHKRENTCGFTVTVNPDTGNVKIDGYYLKKPH